MKFELKFEERKIGDDVKSTHALHQPSSSKHHAALHQIVSSGHVSWLNQPNVAIDGMTVFHAIVFGFEPRLRFD
jgi:hypothetical protein